jgi:hypothetical protein
MNGLTNKQMGKKTLLFTTIGKLNEETHKNTTDAFTSWSGFDVVVFGEDFHKSLCEEYGFILDTEYERTEFGLPLVRSLFESVKKYEGYDVYCYLNSDIRFPKSPRYIIDSMDFENFLLVGQRMDTFTDGSEKLHVAGGIDYYFYTPNFWDLSNMPDFSIARGRFDHWLMGYAYTHGNGNVVDLTNEWIPYHPDPIHRVDGDFGNLFNSGEDVKKAYQIFRNNYYFAKARLHGQTDMARFYVEGGKIKQRENKVKNEFNILF